MLCRYHARAFDWDLLVIAVCVCVSPRTCSNKGCQEHLQKVYAAMAGAMISAAVGGVVFFFIPLGVSGGRGVNGMTRRNALDSFTHCVCVCVCVWCVCGGGGPQ